MAWIRGTPDGDLEQRGRVEGCKVFGRPQLKACYGCPAFRGRDRDGVEQGAFFPTGDLRAMSEREYEAWQDDPDAFLSAMADGSIWNLRHSGTLEWDEHWAAYQRRYRKAHPASDRQRELTRERVRRLRARRREGCNVNHSHTPEDSGEPPGRAGHARARTRPG